MRPLQLQPWTPLRPCPLRPAPTSLPPAAPSPGRPLPSCPAPAPPCGPVAGRWVSSSREMRVQSRDGPLRRWPLRSALAEERGERRRGGGDWGGTKGGRTAMGCIERVSVRETAAGDEEEQEEGRRPTTLLRRRRRRPRSSSSLSPSPARSLDRAASTAAHSHQPCRSLAPRTSTPRSVLPPSPHLISPISPPPLTSLALRTTPTSPRPPRRTWQSTSQSSRSSSPSPRSACACASLFLLVLVAHARPELTLASPPAGSSTRSSTSSTAASPPRATRSYVHSPPRLLLKRDAAR